MKVFLKSRYNNSAENNKKRTVLKLYLLTKIQTPIKDSHTNQLIQDTIKMELDTGHSKEILIEELRKSDSNN